MKKIIYILQREIKLSYYKESNIFTLSMFFILLGSVLALSVPQNSNLLSLVGFPIIWNISMTISFLSFEKWMQTDYLNSSLSLLNKQSLSARSVLFIKIFTHWVMTVIPILISSPLLFLMYHIDVIYYPTFMKCMVLFIISINFLGSLGSILTLGLKHRTLILSIILIPIYIPIYLFSLGTLDLYKMNMEIGYYMSSLFILSFLLCLMCLLVGSKIINLK